MTFLPHILAFNWPIRMEYIPGWTALLLFAVLALPILWLGLRSLNGLGPVRKWVAIGVRLAVLLLFILIIGGIRWQRQHKDLEIMLLSDVSGSTHNVNSYPGAPGRPLRQALDDYFMALAKDPNKHPDDRVGIISFKENARIDVLPTKDLRIDTHAIPEPGTGTDVASAIQLALASLSKEAMHRLVLVWDGNATMGDTEAAIAAAAAQHVQIDVIPLHYDIQNAAMVERFVAPTWKRENEPFTMDIILRSTNSKDITGALSVTHETADSKTPLDMDLSTPEVEPERRVTLHPGLNVEHVRVPAMKQPGVHQFHALFNPDRGSGGVTIEGNNAADAFTFVRGKGEVLYVDNARDDAGNRGPGDGLAAALKAEGISLRQVTIDQLPHNAVQLQSYDAVILANVPFGAGGVDADQDKMLASYVHDMGGGLIMIGGPDAFGAGGWQASDTQKVLPVDMEIPAQRQIGKGALVMIMHSCEMPNGNYWGLQCALNAVAALSDRDEIGVISYGWGGANGGGSQWDFPLQEKGDGSKVIAAVKKMQLGDMPSFDDSFNVALNGRNGEYALAKSNARHKHVIVISDGDPAPPIQKLIDQYKAAKVSVSTVTVYPHTPNAARPPVMDDMPKELGGRAYGPIESNPNQLPKIFIKEAVVVRRSLIHEDADGIPLNLVDASDEFVKGLAGFEPVYGMVLTSRKNDPNVIMSISSGKMNDPVLAHWQTGLGKAVAFTSDASRKWASRWLGSADYSKFWAQVVRGVSRPPMSSDFDVRTTQSGEKGKVVVEALNKDSNFANFISIGGEVVGPDMKKTPIRLVQTAPGTYEAEFDTKKAGNYVLALAYGGQKGEGGVLLSGVAMNSEPEFRDLKSNEGKLKEIADRTNGRMIAPFDAATADLFRRDGLTVTASPMPVWDVLIPILLALILIDVATRRIAWDWNSTKRVAAAVTGKVRDFTTLRRVENRETLDALKRVREEVAETKFRPQERAASAGVTAAARPDPKAKFQAKGVEGDITQVVGGASDKPIPPPPKKIEPKGAPAGPGGHTGSLLEAKRRAQQQIKKKEEGE